MAERELLDRLAAACGIVDGYHDVWGRRHAVPVSTKRALLRAMGRRVETAQQLRAELEEEASAAWRRTLPPVLVLRQPYAELSLPLSLPESELSARRMAALETEDGQRLEQPLLPREIDTGERHTVDGVRRARCRLTLEARPGAGYHRLRIEGAETDALQLIVAPARCHEPSALHAGARVWGPSVQLYALRSSRNWGIGDFTDLDGLARSSAAVGASVVGLGPLHAPRDSRQASPYSPSSRAFLNPLYLDVEAVPELADCPEARDIVASARFQARLASLRRAELVDYEAVARIKSELLATLYRCFRRRHLAADTPRARGFRAFQRERGELLESYGTFAVLEEEQRRADRSAWGWPVWPASLRDPRSEDVRRFGAQHREQVEWQHYLQWLCEEQLAGLERGGGEARLALGIYGDLALGVDRAGFEAWRHQEALAADVALGAPPDEFNPRGQNWGLPPFLPHGLREAAYGPFVESLRPNMRHRGALRIDHVMGLMRSFWIPAGRPASEGAYVLYPFADLRGVLALESARQRCLIVGEDLGTVPDEVRQALEPEGVLSCRLFLFMKDDRGAFLPPRDYPRQALAAATTHDLPTLAGWWSAHDLVVRSGLGIAPDSLSGQDPLVTRNAERREALAALRREGLIDEAGSEMTPELALAIQRYLARTPSMVLTVSLEDVLGQVDQANLPGTTTEHPNWRRKLALDLEALVADPRFVALARALRGERAGRSS